MKNLKYLFASLFALSLIFVGCEEEEYEFGDIISPSNLQITANIVGADASNPYGDGSGEVIFTANASGAITYKFIHNGSEKMAPSGTTKYSFAKTGTHKYVVTVEAIGTAGASSTQSVEVEVLALYEPPADLLQMLHGNSERTWRIKAEGAGHFGVGPSDSEDPIWWAAAPFDKQDWECYDDRFIFRADGTFTHITNGMTFGKLPAMTTDLDGDQGRTGDNNDETVYAWDDYSEEWSLSAPGGNETLTFSNIGYHGFYVGGDHAYTILARSENEMELRTIGADTLGWWVILIADE